ncbi:MAG: hypothetical protein JXA49_10730, partial [Actinobacteria bacterium]|nr:hypothetical protein [Actinomycetota bacterium]
MKNKYGSGLRRAGSRVLFKISVILLSVLIVFSVVSFLFFRRSQNRLIQRSKDQLVEYKVELIDSANNYLINAINMIQKLTVPDASPQSIQKDIEEGASEESITPAQRVVNDILQSMVENRLFEYDLAVFTTTAGSGSEMAIVNSSNDEFMYEQLPPELVGFISGEVGGNPEGEDEGSQVSYMLVEGGFPELSLDGEYLVTAYMFKPDSAESDFYYIGFTPMHDELAAINSFYSSERNNINLMLGLILGGSIIVLIIITFLFLNYLIRRKITRPIDELSAAAGHAMEGDIDVEVP